MAQSSMRKMCRVKKDRISDLPQNIQETILGFLPTEDAVRTSILSKKWRYCWTMIPRLIFDYGLVNRLMRKLIKPGDPELRTHKFVTVINKVLLLHSGPILEFSLCFPNELYLLNEFCKNQIIHEYIDQWIPLFSRKGIKQLTLHESSDLEDFRAHDLSSLDLTHLTLLSVCFPYTPKHGRFTCLKNLKLVDATSNFGKSIFNCPVLEKLTLIICKGLFHTNFCAPNLKCLIQIYREITSEYSLVGLENLSEYSFLLSGYPIMQTETSNVVKVLNGVYKIKRFSIAMYFLKYLAAGGSPYRLSKPLSYLKTLNVSEMNFCDLSVVSCLLCLIRSAPNLCKLHIEADGNPEKVDNEENLKNYSIDDSEDCTIDHLEIVTFDGFRGRRAELELVRFLLGHSPLLKIMSIDHSGCIKRDDELTMAKEMLQYSRASSRAQVRRIKHPAVTAGKLLPLHLIGDGEAQILLTVLVDDRVKLLYESFQVTRATLQKLRELKGMTKVKLCLQSGKVWNLSSCDLCEIARNLVYHSGFSHVLKWISLLSRKGIKQLSIQDFSLPESNAHDFSSLGLTHLRLLSVWFPYTSTCGRFANLKILELVDATSKFGHSIFDCPVLEKLTLISCQGLFPHNFCAPNLRCLIQLYHSATPEYSLAGLENLEEFSFMLLKDFVELTFNVVIVPGGLHKIKKFTIARDFIKYLAEGGSPNRLPKPMPYLKAINISDIDFTVLSEVSCLIRSAPNLCQLHISDVEYAGEGDLEDYCIEDSADCTIHHLEIVSFSEFKGLRAELELVKFLLAHSLSLKTLFIHRHWSIKEGASALKITEEMLQYARASSSAQIKHLERPVEIIDNFDSELWSEYTF
ncbi:hypothetical protein POM88_048911 [Heracleum sosnowskyi]|uniref:F-box domain-containing protein n=1 Tax=Heracleum sosnowskyi TaxID=360622 RepID=A0AAD8GUN0_9APIA|nr:hypothetical protein POM88_048911 [Heracleum sosnowskyi]